MGKRTPSVLTESSAAASNVAHAWRRRIPELLIATAVLATGEPTPISLIVGGVFAVAGEILRVIAAGYGYRVGELSVRGPYRFVRHPYFLGTALINIGLAVAGRHAVVAAAVVAFAAIQFRVTMRRDERRWESRLGPKFAEYKARVPALLPRLYPIAATGDDKRLFSLGYAVLGGRHREFDALLGLGVMFGLLYLSQRLVVKAPFQLGVLGLVGLYLLVRFIYDAASRAPLRGLRPSRGR